MKSTEYLQFYAKNQKNVIDKLKRLVYNIKK